MRIRKTFHTIDTHTGGAPTRNIIGGLPSIHGSTMKEKMVYMMEHGDWVRKMLCFEPRGNEVMSGTIITAPCDPRADVGVLYFEVGFWMPMCGHDTIGVATALIESGMIDVQEPVTKIVLDTPAGLIYLDVEVVNATAKTVTFTNAPAFVLAENAVVQSETYGEVKMDVAYGGNIYAILPITSVDLELTQENAASIVRAGNILKNEINDQISVQHPELEFENHVTHIEFYDPVPSEDGTIRNAVVVPPGAIDRSPCGTGTSAKCAVLARKNQLKISESFTHESLIGSRFTCVYLEDAEVAGIPAIVPRVTGSAWVTGVHTFMLDPDDPFPMGFQI